VPARQGLGRAVGGGQSTVQVPVWFDEARAGKFDLTIGIISSTLINPSDYFNT
jgi:hypothetical protein